MAPGRALDLEPTAPGFKSGEGEPAEAAPDCRPDAKTATDALHDQLQTALADKVDLERHLESVQRELGDVQEAKNSALGDLDRSNQEVDSLREELREMRRRVQAAEDAGSKRRKSYTS